MRMGREPMILTNFSAKIGRQALLLRYTITLMIE